MNIKEFQEVSKRTMKWDEFSHLHCAMGVSGEAGEVVDIIKKSHFYNKPIDKNHLDEEIGDVMFYIVNLASCYGLDFETILENNFNKLSKRYPKGYNDKDAVTRMDKSNE